MVTLSGNCPAPWAWHDLEGLCAVTAAVMGKMVTAGMSPAPVLSPAYKRGFTQSPSSLQGGCGRARLSILGFGVTETGGKGRELEGGGVCGWSWKRSLRGRNFGKKRCGIRFGMQRSKWERKNRILKSIVLIYSILFLVFESGHK